MTRNWFEQGGGNYAAHRPDYPAELGAELARIAPRRGTAVDVGCGTGQLTGLLAEHFTHVIGVDPGEDQLAHAAPARGVDYVHGTAEDLPVADGRADLVTAAQAAHWFDLPAFYTQARRIAAPGAVLALISYGVVKVEPGLRERFERFYWREISSFWPPERRLVETGYRDIDFPFPQVPVAALSIRRSWPLDAFLGYLGTWSAVRNAAESGHDDVLRHYAAELTEAWGEPSRPRDVVWPITMRAGRLDGESR
ncbi:class I SAM-dependent methyltransferase [Kocuria sp.]|uniref:class I SAM-dependent methyltransferase n=1 Tax=Kocuria sp. TaxID=1871328 RepID=UPI0028A9E4F8|nr:class I SAM-dependent methyltransferase [Kocuria sp.]